MTKPGHTTIARTAAALLAAPLILSLGVGAATATTTIPPTATTGSVTSVKPTSVVLHSTVNPEGTATTWSFQYGPSTSASYGTTTPGKTAGSGSSDVAFASTVAGLAPATSYHYRVVAASSAGTTFGGEGVFNTSAAPVVLTEAASHLTASSATLNSIVNPEGLATSWYFQFGTTSAYGSITPTIKMPASPNDANVSADISNLLPRTAYHFRIVASSSAGSTRGVDFALTTGLAVTLSTLTSTVVYGGAVNLSGAVAGGSAGEHVTVSSEMFNQPSFTAIAVVVTGIGGAWSYSAQPTARTSFEASANNGTSSPIVVSVRPSISLKIGGAGRLSTQVQAGVPFSSHVLQLQRLSHGLWVTWKHVRLNGSATALFATSLPKGRTSIRMAIAPFVTGVDQSAPGYLAGFSHPINYDQR